MISSARKAGILWDPGSSEMPNNTASKGKISHNQQTEHLHLYLSLSLSLSPSPSQRGLPFGQGEPITCLICLSICLVISKGTAMSLQSGTVQFVDLFVGAVKSQPPCSPSPLFQLLLSVHPLLRAAVEPPVLREPRARSRGDDQPLDRVLQARGGGPEVEVGQPQRGTNMASRALISATGNRPIACELFLRGVVYSYPNSYAPVHRPLIRLQNNLADIDATLDTSL